MSAGRAGAASDESDCSSDEASSEEEQPSAKKRKEPCSDARGGARVQSIGVEHCIFMLVTETGYETCSKTTKNRKADSIVARYARVKGFKGIQADADFDRAHPEAEAASRRARSATHILEAWVDVLRKHAIFERFMLTAFPDSEYSAWLGRCRDLGVESDGSSLTFMPPLSTHLTSFMDLYHTKKGDPTDFGGLVGRGCKGTYIKSVFDAVHTLCAQNDCKDRPAAQISLSNSIKKAKRQEVQKRAPGFDFAEELPKFFSAVFNMARWSAMAKIKNWAWILFAISVVGRASDVTIYCPNIEDTKFPEHSTYYDSDGLPKFLDVAFTNWKKRAPKYIGTKYYNRIHRNYLDTRFCPVSWLTLFVKYSKRRRGPYFVPEGGDRFKTSQPFVLMVMRVFQEVGLPDLTSHSLRRSTYQWAGRCNGQESKMKLTARHTGNTNCFVRYLADGYENHTGFEEAGLPDPIEKMWVWKPGIPNKQPEAEDFVN